MRPTLLVLEARSLLSTIVVNNPTDIPVAGKIDLRQAIAMANTNGGAETITFDSTVFKTPQTITLTGTQLELSDTTGTMTITGPAGGVTVSGGGLSRVFQVDKLVAASISGLTITGGNAGNSYGGGLYNLGTTSLTNCTVSGNTAGLTGGGLANGNYSNKGDSLTLINCTVSGNTAGGLFTYFGTTTATNTIIAGNDFDISGALAPASTNNVVGVDPLVAPLNNYGGTGETMALLPGSPAIDAGISGPGIPTTDERGVSRVGAVDIGAFESSGFTIAVASGSGQSASGAFSAPLVATVTAKHPIEPVAGGLVTFTPPPSGPSATISGSPAVIASDGTASVTAASNFIGGNYTVSATAAGAPGAASFGLTNYAVRSIAISPGNPSLAVGVSAQFIATGTFTDGATHDITSTVAWSSGTPSAATISATGVATGVAVGTSQITASLTGVTSPGDTLHVIAPSFLVNTANDAFGFFSGKTSLREAIASADVVPGQTITFDPTVFNTPQTITLTGTQLELSNTTGTTTINGPAGGVTVSGGGLSRVFQVDKLVAASISGLTITGGNVGYLNGGGLLNYGTAGLTNCTVSGNTAGFSGGSVANGSYFNQGASLTLINCTVSGNTGGGLATYFGTTTATNTIIAGNSFVDVFGSLSTASSHNVVGENPVLAPLGNYGGTSETMALLPGSPAIDAGTSGPGIPTTDERGLPRFGTVDIGAFESQGFTVAPVPGGTPQTASIGTSFANPLAVTVKAKNSVEPVDGGVVSFVAGRVSGATAILSAPSAVIAGGQAAVGAIPNNAVGTYTVVASASGLSPVPFTLTNAGPRFNSLVVNTTSDAMFPGKGLLSLREAVVFANYDSLGISAITFDTQAFAKPQTITLTGSQLELSNATERESITGPKAGVTVSGGGLSRVFQIDTPVTASLSGLTISGGNAGTFGNGGGVLNYGTAALTGCTISGNSAGPTSMSPYGGGSGGGLANFGTATLTGCTVMGNAAHASPFSFLGGSGGGVYNDGTATLAHCTISGNTGSGGGGLATGSLESNPTARSTLSYCTVSGNTGGGVANSDTTTLTNCTVSGNTNGAAVFTLPGFGNSSCVTTLSNCTISGNADVGVLTAAIVFYGPGSVFVLPGVSNLTNCTISGNSGTGLLTSYGKTTATGTTISNNATSFSGGGVINDGLTSNGKTYGTTTLTSCTISGNSAGLDGGGVFTGGGATTLNNCTVSGNTAGRNGGALANASPGSTTLTGTTVKNNSAVAGGGIYNTGTLNVTSSNLLNNSARGSAGGAGIGGGILSNGGSVALVRSTLSGNMATGGAGVSGGAGGNGIGGGLALENNATATVANTTFQGNLAQGGAGGTGANGGAGIGGGIAVAIGSILGTSDTSSLTISNSMLTLNEASGGLGGRGASGGAGWGAGAFVGSSGTAAFTGVTIASNTAAGGLPGVGGSPGAALGYSLYIAPGGVATLKKSAVTLSFASFTVSNIYGTVIYL
jgi:hypothetical protein